MYAGLPPLAAKFLIHPLASLAPVPALVGHWEGGSTTSLVGMFVFQAIPG